MLGWSGTVMLRSTRGKVLVRGGDTVLGTHKLLDLVEPETAADALEEMDPDELHQLLTETDTSHAARLLARMEPDEAADALRDLSRRAHGPAGRPAASPTRIRGAGNTRTSAGGAMTTVLVLAHRRHRRRGAPRLRAQAKHAVDLDAIIVVDDDGRLADDISVGELLLAEPGTALSELMGPPWPVTVTTDPTCAKSPTG